MKTKHLFALIVCLLASINATAHADVRLPHVLSDHMVLQRGMPIPVWGWAAPGESVTVSLADAKVSTKADTAGHWRVDLPAMSAGGPHKLTVAGTNTLTLQDILIGEVWICIGQSNMQFPLISTQFGRRDIGQAADPQFRICFPGGNVAGQPQTEASAAWVASSPGAVARFSAVAYYFGKELRAKLGVPVGVIHWSAGAIPIESWTPAVGLKLIPSQVKMARIAEQADADYVKLREKILQTWNEKKLQAMADKKPAPPMPPVDDRMVQRGWMPTGLYNGVIHPIVPYGIRGVVLYQGEANNGQGMEYLEKMHALIDGWRKVWGQGDFPFLYVQIAPWAGYPAGNVEGIWEAQLAALSIPNTGMVVVTDQVPNLNDIHPTQKLEVGRRLALLALATIYGQDKLVHSGPLFKSAAIASDTIRVEFNHVGGGLATRDNKAPNFFQLGTADGFVDAEAKIEGNAVVVSSSKVPHPLYVRFGWKNTAQPNLINKEGLPASPFRTDCGPVKFSTGSRFARRKLVQLTADFEPGTIRYTLDGSTPTEQSLAYTKPIEINKTTTISARLFAADGRSSVTSHATYTQVEPVTWEGKTLAPGIDYDFYFGRWVTMPDFATLKVDRQGTIDTIRPLAFSESFLGAHRLRGYLDIPTAGDYTFSFKALGGAQLRLDGKLIVDDEGLHLPVEKTGPRVTLTAGKHPIEITYHEGGAPPNLALFYTGPGITKQEVPATALFHEE
ncbi:MAG: chitobiase/beta-hexosaminidase C-terminal domain-containing protein [Planctomycetia bacterium]|nr:chitobiase/beta-hexosaminidase C-terminal domain-containing protein [Planctomycetia bacterium]